ncbi:hypothetical protein C0J52_06383 [Blattella germanica]|nr:hypothetical protein C0J52_06383 [Blattella germanica]
MKWRFTFNISTLSDQNHNITITSGDLLSNRGKDSNRSCYVGLPYTRCSFYFVRLLVLSCIKIFHFFEASLRSQKDANGSCTYVREVA